MRSHTPLGNGLSCQARRVVVGAAAWGMLATTACVGEITSGDDSTAGGPQTGQAVPGGPSNGAASNPFAGEATAPPIECNASGLPDSGFRRLNAREFRNVASELLKVEVELSSLPADGVSLSGYDTDAASLRVLELDADKYYVGVEKAVGQAFAGGTDPFVGCAAAAPARAACLNERLSAFLKSAFRRTPPAAVLEGIQALRAAEPDEREGLKSALIAGLLSARTIYLNSSNAQVGPGQSYRLDDFQIAERLAFFLWSSSPDAELLGLATRGELSNVATLKQVATRMMADRKFDGFMQGFVTSWLGLRNTADLRKDQQRYPLFSPQLLSDMVEETQLFMVDLLRGPRPLSDVLLGRETYANSRLAALYQIPGVTGEEFQKVTLPVDTRMGLLTQGAVLAVTGGESQPSPVKRGLWLTRKITCTEPPPPPPDVPILDLSEQAGLNPREALEQHRQNPACAACHALLDPLGLALEKYDSMGGYRQSYDDGSLIDATGTWQEASFDGATELSHLLATESIPGCMTHHVSTYVLGNIPDKVENCFAKALVGRFEQGERDFSELVQQLVTSELFFKAVVKGETP